MRVGYTSEFLACSAPYSCSRFVLSSTLVASPFHIYNIPKCLSGNGSLVVFLDVARYVKVEYKLVSSEEVDAEKGLISTTSPIGRALLNRRVGDEIEVATPAGKKEFEIVELVTIHDGE